MLDKIAGHVESGVRLTRPEAIFLWENATLHEFGFLADRVRQRFHPDRVVTYVIDRNINYTNICESGCRFCAFYRKTGAPDAYVLSRAEIFQKIEETLALGGTGILFQGGLHPELDIRYFEELLRDIRGRYRVDLHCFSPPEIVHISRISRISMEECLRRLVAAGLSSLPGGGAEILCDEVRSGLSPKKCTATEWLAVMETAHRLGLKTTATMMFGSGESLAHRLAHLELIRSLQDRRGGFVAFIPWSFQWPNTELGREVQREATGVEYLKMVALSRLVLDNVPAIQASWVTQGLKVAQVALRFGANDIGSVMIEENVVAAAGACFRTNEAELRHLVADAGFIPVKRNNVHDRVEGGKVDR